MSGRCDTCDREGCKRGALWRLAVSVHANGADEDAYRAAYNDCRDHRVDWRTRCLTAEARVAELETALREALDGWDFAACRRVLDGKPAPGAPPRGER